MQKIQNAKDLATTELRRNALEIAEAGFQAIDTPAVVKNQIHFKGDNLIIQGKKYSLQGIKRLLVVGVGKCALAGAEALEEILGERIADGVVLDTKAGTLQYIKSLQGDHPLPTERNAKAAKEIIDLLNTATEKDLVLFLVSGGGSILLCQPETLTCREESTILRCLFDAGAAIQDINILRKHLSLARGGYLAQYVYPAKSISLIFSDVPGNNLSFVASGPTIKDETTKEDAKGILERYQVKECCGISEIELLETPKEDKYFERTTNILFLSNETALTAMKQKAEELGLKASIQTRELAGEAKEAGKDIAKELRETSLNVLLYGGETTVVIKHPGKGGRNLELGLSALSFLQEEELVFAFASDGLDNTVAAGALCDILTKEKAQKKGINPKKYIEENRSYEFFDKTGDLVFTGPTTSNVSDLVIAIKA